MLENPSSQRSYVCPKLGRFGRFALFTGAAILISGCASVDAMKRVEIDFDYVVEMAEELSKKPYREPVPVPEYLRELDYDDYRKIRYNADRYLWKDENLSFSLGFFHLGFLHGDRVKVNEYTATHVQRIRYLKEFFDFGDPAVREAMPGDLDYAGFRLAYLADGANDYREFTSFLGASYFRGTGLDTRYGTSARGLAINSGLATPEEFPKFTEYWLGKPQVDSQKVVLYALLESPSATGAYEFVFTPGKATTTDVRARIFVRQQVESFGVAPLTSMFWRGENRKGEEEDYRPEVHDADGLVILEKDGEPLWRALDIDERTRLSYFSVPELGGFGLMQRDRNFSSYQDLEAEYHNRPSVWVEAKNDWGKGYVKLVELPTKSEFEDNIVAYWEPAVLPEAGDVLDFEYKISWAPGPVEAVLSGAPVVATRKGVDPSYPGTEVFVIDFDGAQGAGEPELVVAVEGAASLVSQQVVWNKFSETWRVVLRVEGGEEGEVTELRSQLLFPNGQNSETWSYQWIR